MQADYSTLNIYTKSLENNNKELDNLDKEMGNCVEAEANAIKEYVVALTRALEIMVDGKYLTSDKARGQQSVADAGYRQDIAKLNLKALNTRIKTVRYHIDSAITLISTEKAKINLK